MKPVLQALVLADQIYEDKTTGKMIIAGTFTKIIKREIQSKPGEEVKLQGLPSWTAGSPHAYIRLTEIRDEAELELRFVDLAENKALQLAKLKVRCKNPLESVEIHVPLPPFQPLHPGVYSLEILCEDELLGSWNVTAETVGGVEEGGTE